MGKKIKQDGKLQSDDVFDGLKIDANELETAVLMLTSSENDVLVRSCESIFRYAEKSEDNKRSVFNLNCIEFLVKLLNHEDGIVSRNALMALGSLSSLDETRAILKSNSSCVSLLVQLLQVDKGRIVNEFASLCLSFLAEDYDMKIAIMENNALKPLVNLLSFSDPDIQKNSIETISLLMLDYETKSLVRDVNAFAPILELMHSEYPIIQQLALTTLTRATEDVTNRTVLRELDGINKLIDFLGHPEWKDLHVAAVMVIANCLEDAENVRYVKDNNGLGKLFAMITDTQPPEEEEKKTKEKPKRVTSSRGGKKNKGDDEDKGKASKLGKHLDDNVIANVISIIPSTAELKESACKAIARAAKNEDVRVIFQEQDIEKVLINLLINSEIKTQTAAAQSLGVLSLSTISNERIGKLGGIEPLVKLLKSEEGEMTETVSLVLANVTHSNLPNCQEVIRCKGIGTIVELLNSTNQNTVRNAAIILYNMASDRKIRLEIIKTGALKASVNPLSSNNDLVLSTISALIALLTVDAETRKQFHDAGGTNPLLELISSKDDSVRKNSSLAISNLCTDKNIAADIYQNGGLVGLLEIESSKKRKNIYSTRAKERILDSNLSLKFALSGQLNSSDIIENGFYDTGKITIENKLQSLEFYCKTELSEKSTTLLINSKFEKPSNDIDSRPETSSRASVTGRHSSMARSSKSSSRSKKERDEKQKEMLAKKEVFVPPSDTALGKMIEDVQERIQPLPTSHDQIISLALFVCEKMGGAIESLVNFSWELPLNQIKYNLKSNVVPIGYVTAGNQHHRALLFKVLADRIGIQATLVREDYYKSWNEVSFLNEDGNLFSGLITPQRFVVDLVSKPGRLMPIDSLDAQNYIIL